MKSMTIRGAGATGAAEATAPVAQIVRGQHGGSTGAARGQEVGLLTRTARQNTRAIVFLSNLA